MKNKGFICIVFTLLLCLVLSATAGADTPGHSILQLREQATQGWRQTYEAHGRIITVDVMIEVPEAERFPAFRAVRQPLSTLVPEEGLTDEFGFFDGENTIGNAPGILNWIAGNAKDQHRWALEYQRQHGSEPSFEGRTHYPWEVDWDVPYSINNEATVRSLHDKALTIWQQFFPGLPLNLQLVEAWAGTAYRKIDMGSMEFVGPALETEANAYLAPKFEQLHANIPLLAYAETSMTIFGGRYLKRPPEIARDLACGVMVHSRSLKHMGREGLQENMVFRTLVIADQLVEDLPLCSVEEAIAAYEALIRSGQLRHVHRLRLGYGIWEDREHPEQFLLQPTWVAWGVLLENPKKEAWYDKKFGSLGESRFWESNEYGPILVNAQTGELIAPWRTDPGRAQDALPLILWQEPSAP